jgi:hypothetical protein
LRYNWRIKRAFKVLPIHRFGLGGGIVEQKKCLLSEDEEKMYDLKNETNL